MRRSRRLWDARAIAVATAHPVNWLAMRGALGPDARPHVEAYYAHRIMGYGLQSYVTG